MLGNGLAYVAFVVTDVEATAATLVRDFDLHRTDCTVGDSQRTAPVLSVGESAFALFAPDDPFLGGPAKAGVHHIALQVDDFPAATAFVASKGLSDTTTPQVGLGGTRRLLLHAPATAHVLTYLSEPLHVQPSPAGWVERIDHIGIASSDNTTAIDVFSHRLGYALESTQTDMEVQLAVESFTSDKYGVVYHTRPAHRSVECALPSLPLVIVNWNFCKTSIRSSVCKSNTDRLATPNKIVAQLLALLRHVGRDCIMSHSR